MSKSTDCPHCYPSQPNHAYEKTISVLDAYFGEWLDKLSTYLPTQLFRSLGNALQRIVIDFSRLIRHSKFTDVIDRSQLNNGILVIWDEAKRRGLSIFNIQFGRRHTQYFVLYYGGKRYLFDRSPINLIARKKPHDSDASKFDDKSTLKKLLLQHDLPCPEGYSFHSAQEAMEYGLRLGFPLVVKPAVSSFSRHVTFNITTKLELERAIDIAKKIHYRIVVEKHIPGDVHRVTILDKAVVAITKRQASKIIGDGESSIEELIAEKNNHPWRGDPKRLDCSLHKIEKNAHLDKILAKQRVNLKTKLKKGSEIYLSEKMNSGNGADVTNVTALLHPDNEKLFLQVHRLLNLPLSGLDFICQDVSLPWHRQPFAIIENNSLPYIDAHHYPSIGEPINVAEKLWDLVLASLQK